MFRRKPGIQNERRVEEKKPSNPYQRFVERHNEASPQDLTKYFELRTTRFNTLSTIVAAVLLSLLAILITTYVKILEQPLISMVIMLAGSALLLSFIVVLNLRRVLSGLRDKYFDDQFDLYLEAKKQLESK